MRKITADNFQEHIAELTQEDTSLMQRLDAYKQIQATYDVKRDLMRDFMFASDLAFELSMYCDF